MTDTALFPWTYGPIPFYVGFIPSLVAVAFPFLLSLFLFRTVHSSIGARDYPGDEGHWSLRARSLFPLRIFSGSGLLLMLLMPTVGARLWSSEDFSHASLLQLSVVSTVSGTLGWLFETSRMNRKYKLPADTLGQVLKDFVFVVLGRTVGIFVAVIVALTAPKSPGMLQLLWYAVGSAAVFVAIFKSGLPLLRWLGFARPASARVSAAVQQACAQLDVKVPKIYEVPWSAPNAVAFLHANTLVFSDALLETIDDHELQAVALHEMAHLGESPSVKWIRFGANAAVALPIMFAPLLLNVWVPLFPIVLFVGGLLSAAINARFQEMEERADQQSVSHEAVEGTFARALEKMHRAALMPAVLRGKRKSHPDLYDRMVAAGVSPDFEKPDPPSTRASRGVMLLCMLTLFAICLPRLVRKAVLPSMVENPQGATLLLASSGGSLDDLYTLRDAAEEADDLDNALYYIDIAYSLEPDADDFDMHWTYAAEYVYIDKCDAARAAFARAERTRAKNPNEPIDEAAWTTTKHDVESCR